MAAAVESLTVPTMTALLDCAMAHATLKMKKQAVEQVVRKLLNGCMERSPFAIKSRLKEILSRWGSPIAGWQPAADCFSHDRTVCKNCGADPRSADGPLAGLPV